MSWNATFFVTFNSSISNFNHSDEEREQIEKLCIDLTKDNFFVRHNTLYKSTDLEYGKKVGNSYQWVVHLYAHDEDDYEYINREESKYIFQNFVDKIALRIRTNYGYKYNLSSFDRFNNFPTVQCNVSWYRATDSE